ncbi:hypothetical protein CP969_00050 [Streptomyces viridosporus T7A]|uniref:DUF222 domain-containing protein n=2 Tax=Streptomyces viridosporus TaxID=67581 RepID=A0ABX6A8V6_STRVD|nr:hypothetical protein CP969_00050 [Streptomyces viridosporus T7A]
MPHDRPAAPVAPRGLRRPLRDVRRHAGPAVQAVVRHRLHRRRRPPRRRPAPGGRRPRPYPPCGCPQGAPPLNARLPQEESTVMAEELKTQQQFDAFAEEVATALGTHCRTAPLPGYRRGLARLIVDDEDRALRLCQPDARRPQRLKVFAGLPDEERVAAPSIQVSTISAAHVAREIKRRLYPLHAQAMEQAAQLTAYQQTEAHARRAVAAAVAAALPGARIEEEHRRTRISWQHVPGPVGQHRPVQVDSLSVVVGTSGEWVQVDACGRPDLMIPMLTALTQVPRE